METSKETRNKIIQIIVNAVIAIVSLLTGLSL